VLANLLLPVLTLSAGTAPADSRPATPLGQAVAYCEFHAAGVDGTINLPGTAVWYQPIHPALAQRVRSMGKGRMIGRTSSEVPALVKRFAETQPAGRRSGVAPIWFDYYSFSPQVWAVNYPGLKACDVMVTGAENHLAWREQQLASMQQHGWTANPANAAGNGEFWSVRYAKPGVDLQIEGLGIKADRNGVQMSWQFQRAATN
jgi:hypothetical protein